MKTTDAIAAASSAYASGTARASQSLSATRNALSGQSPQVGIGDGSTSTTESGPSVTTIVTASTIQRSRSGRRPIG